MPRGASPRSIIDATGTRLDLDAQSKAERRWARRWRIRRVRTCAFACPTRRCPARNRHAHHRVEYTAAEGPRDMVAP